MKTRSRDLAAWLAKDLLVPLVELLEKGDGPSTT